MDHPYPPPRVLAFAFFVSLALFAVIVADVAFDGLLATRLDPWVADAVREDVDVRTRITWFHDRLSWPGDDAVLLPLNVLGTLACVAFGRYANAAFLFLGTGFGTGLGFWLKDLFGRERPSGPSHSFAFPSGHALGTVLVFGLVFALVLDAFVRRRRLFRDASCPPWLPRALLGLWIGLGVTVGVARVLGGVHWPTDVVGGSAVGVALVAALLLAHSRAAARWPAWV